MKKSARKLTPTRSAPATQQGEVIAIQPIHRSLRVSCLLVGALLVGQTVAAQVPWQGKEGDRRPDNRSGIVPTIPVILDGVEFPAGALPPASSARTFVVTPEDQKNGTVHAFSSLEVAEEFTRLQTLKSGTVGSSEELSSCAHPYDFSAFNKNRGGGGSDTLFMDMYPTTGDPGIYWNLDFGGWNNTISWVAAACNGFTTAVYSCRNFELNETFFCEDPDRFYIFPGMIIPDLVPYGFNNRTSSIKFGA